MSRKRLEEEWNLYSRTVLSKEAPAIQRRECRMAFLAGCAAAIGILNQCVDMPEDEQGVFIRELGKELMEMKP